MKSGNRDLFFNDLKNSDEIQKFVDCENKINNINITAYAGLIIKGNLTTDLDSILTEPQKETARAIADRQKQADQDVLRSRMNYGSI
jgi:hypothetical protein